jgi:hypothetical protein
MPVAEIVHWFFFIEGGQGCFSFPDVEEKGNESTFQTKKFQVFQPGRILLNRK